MSNIVADFFRRISPTKRRRLPDKENVCYVLITCHQPTADGKMQVEMTYEGDAVLAAYLIESAKGLMDEQSEAQ